MRGVVLFSGPNEGERVLGLGPNLLAELSKIARDGPIPLLIEADGSRRLPLKAPAAHEPAVPAWVNCVIVVVGLSGLGRSIDAVNIHRPEIFSKLSGLPLGSIVTWKGLCEFLRHPDGGRKNIPSGARPVLLLNQVDSMERLTEARQLANSLRDLFPRIVIAQLNDPASGVIETVTTGGRTNW
jgi:molybdenum cofactor cytidylyltransferase